MKRFLMTACFILLALVPAGCRKGAQGPTKIGFMPKLEGIPYFNACHKGALEAADELGLELIYNGPNKADAGLQIDILNQWINSGRYSYICLACNDRDLVAPFLRDGRDRGVNIITYDADTVPDARNYFVNQATYDDVAQAMVDAMAEDLGDAIKAQSDAGDKVKIAILTSSKTAPNQSEWARRIRTYASQKYPAFQILEETEHGEDRDEGIKKAEALLRAHKDLKGILGLTSVAVPAAAEAVRQQGKKGQVKVTGVSTPRDMKDYVLDGTVKTVILWNPVDLGYLTVYVADLDRRGKMVHDGTIEAGRLGKIHVKNGEVLLGKPLKFTKENIEKYDF